MIALSAGSLYSYGLQRTFQLAAEAGFEGIEIIIDERWDTRQPEYLTRLAAEFGLDIVSFHAPFSPQLYGWEKGRIEGILESVKLAEALSARTLVLHLPLFFEREYANWLKTGLPELRRRTSVVVAVENLPRTYQVPRFIPRSWSHWRFQPARLKDESKEWLLPFIKLLGRETFLYNEISELERFAPLALDTTHLATGGFDIREIFQRLKDKVVHVHLSNYDKREHTLPHKGVLPVAGFLEDLKSAGFSGILTLELNPQSLEAGSEKKVKKNLRDSLDFCRQYFG